MTGWLVHGVMLAVLAAAPAWPEAPADHAPLFCDGTPPELVNKDDADHPYELKCGRKKSQHTLAAGETQSLDGKSGCQLTLGDNDATVLHTEMVCTVTGGKLSCDLL